MTAIVAISGPDLVVLASDSAVTTGWGTVETLSRPKIIHHRPTGTMVAISGRVRASEVLRWRFDPPWQDPRQENDGWVATTLTDHIRWLMKESGLAHIENNEEHFHSAGVIVYRGSVYDLGIDYALTRTRDTYSAIGSGREFALGSLYSSEYEPNAIERALVALRAAAKFNPYVRGPFHLATQMLDNGKWVSSIDTVEYI